MKRGVRCVPQRNRQLRPAETALSSRDHQDDINDAVRWTPDLPGVAALVEESGEGSAFHTEHEARRVDDVVDAHESRFS